MASRGARRRLMAPSHGSVHCVIGNISASARWSPELFTPRRVPLVWDTLDQSPLDPIENASATP